MKDQVPPEGSISLEGLDEFGSTERQRLAASIERDFRSLLDALKFSQSIADSKAAPHIERVKAVVERGIDLSLRLRNMTESERRAG